MNRAKRVFQIITGVLSILLAVYLSIEWYIAGMFFAVPFLVCGILMCIHPERNGTLNNFTARTVVLLIFCCLYLAFFIFSSYSSNIFKFEIVFLAPIFVGTIICLSLKH